MPNATHYTPRHLAPVAGQRDVSADQRRHVDSIRAGMAIVAIFKTLDSAPSSRRLWAELRGHEALHPTARPSVHIAALGISA